MNENLFRSIHKEAIRQWNEYQKNRDLEDWGGSYDPSNREYWIVKVAYEWGINGIVR